MPAPQDDSKADRHNMSMMKRNQLENSIITSGCSRQRVLMAMVMLIGLKKTSLEMMGMTNSKGGMMESNDKPWKPLSRRLPIPQSIISPYRLGLA